MEPMESEPATSAPPPPPPPPPTASDADPLPPPAPETEAAVASNPPPSAPSSQQQPQPSTSSSAPSQSGTPQIPQSASPFPALQQPPNTNSQPQLQPHSQLPSQFQTQPQPQTVAPPVAQAPQAQSQPQPQQVQQSQQWMPQPGRPFRPTQPQFPSHFTPHVPSPAATAAGPASTLPSPASSLPPPSGPLQRGGMAIGVPAALPHPRAQQQSAVPFSSFAASATFNQTYNGLSRGSVGMPNQAAGAGVQVRQPVQAIQNVGVVGAHAAPSVRPGGVPGNHQQRPGQPTLRSPSPSNNLSLTGQKFQSHGLIRGQSVSSRGSSLPGPSQSSQSIQQPWMSTAGRPTNPPSLSTPSYRPQNKVQGLQQRTHQPQQQTQSMPTTSHQQPMPASQQQQKPLQHLQQHQKLFQQQQQLPQTQQQQQQQQPPLQPQQQQQQVAMPIQSISKVQQSAHQQQQLSRSASQKTLVPATLQQGATQPSPASPSAATDIGESGNRIISKRNIHELVTQIDPSEKLDPEVEDILVEIAEDFVESITTFGCSLAKHRKSTTLEAKDILLHLERNWNMTIPGFGGDEIKCYKKPFTNDIHKERLSLIKKSMISTPDAGHAKNSSAGQTATNSKSHAARAPLIGSPKVT